MGKIGKSIRLLKSEVEALEPRLRQYFIPVVDRGVPQGLNIRVTPTGVKSWYLRVRLEGQQCTIRLGEGAYPAVTPEQAKAHANEAWTKINQKENPAQTRAATRRAERLATTVATLAARFESEHMEAKNKPSTRLVNARYLKADIVPGLGKFKVKDVTKADIAAFLTNIQAEGKTGKAYTISRILSKMFAKAELWGLRPEGTNPARGQECPQPAKRARRLSDVEIHRLGKVLRQSSENPYAIAAFRLYLLTGMRLSELLGNERLGIQPLTWDGINHVDLDRGVIHLHDHKTAGKIGPRDLVLCLAARKELEGLQQIQMLNNPCVIPGIAPGRALVNIHDTWNRVRAVARIPDVTIHDLRRSFVSMGADLGLPDYFADAQTGHAAATVTDTYRRVGMDPLRDAVEAIGARIAGLLYGEIDPAKEAEERAKPKAAKQA